MLALLSAGILLASCKKDKNDEPTPSSSVTTDTTQVTLDNNPQNPDNPDNGENNPPTTNSIVINVAIEAIEGIDNPSFTAEDVLTISEGETKLGTLTLQDTDGNFNGELTTAPSNEGAELTATIILNEGSEISSSTESIPDLIKKCAHNYTGTFKYKTDTKVMLTDDRAYIEFTLAEGQKKVSVNGQWYDVDQTTHKAYVAVESNTEVTTRIKGKETLTAGKIYTIECTEVVDLGPTFSVLWKTTNETGGTVSSSYSQSDAETSVYKDEKYYNWANACAFGRINESDEYEKALLTHLFRLPTKAELEALGSDTWKTKNSVNGREFSTNYGSVFFPAAGLYGGNYAGSEGYYWSGESNDGSRAYVLDFDDGSARVGPSDVNGKFSVRLVRGL